MMAGCRWRLVVSRGAIVLAVAGASVVTSHTTALAATDASSVASTWRVNGNGAAGDIVLTQAADGTLGGTIYGDPLTGFYASGARTAILLRGPVKRPFQVFVGQVSTDGASMSGTFFGLDTSASGASKARNEFGFVALRSTVTPATPAAPSGVAGPERVEGVLAVYNRPAEFGTSQAGTLDLRQGQDGTLTGTVFGSPIYGLYAAQTGTAAFVRLADDRPFQFFVGRAAGGLKGDFFALTPGSGATVARVRYDWSTAAAAAAPSAGAFVGPSGLKSGVSTVPALPQPVTITCPANASEAGPSSRAQGWSFNSAWATLLRAEVRSVAGKAQVDCLYGFASPVSNGSYPSQELTLLTSAGAGITAAMCSVAGSTVSCQGRAPLTCPAPGVEAGASRRLGQPWSFATSFPERLKRVELVSSGSGTAGVGISCHYGAGSPGSRQEVLLSLFRDVGAGFSPAKCSVSGATVTCQP